MQFSTGVGSKQGGLCRTGQYQGHSGNIVQLMVLGEQLLSLGEDCQLLVWRIADYKEPEVGIRLAAEVWQMCLLSH